MRKSTIIFGIVLCALTLAVVSGDAAFASPFPDGHYVKLKIKGKDNWCLEGNRLSSESVLKGAAFMNDCDRQTGQYWKAKPVPGKSGYYWLQTKFLESKNKCLEGNRLSPQSVLKGAAFMNDCDRQTGQFWKFVPDGNGYFRMKTDFQGDNKCLEGNGLHPKAFMGGASFMDDCKNVTGQKWRVEVIR